MIERNVVEGKRSDGNSLKFSAMIEKVKGKKKREVIPVVVILL